MENLNITAENGVKTIEVLQGQTKKHSYPTPLNLKGIITAPYAFLEKRISEITQKQCVLEVERDLGKMTLTINERCEFKDVISGELKLNPDFMKWGINTGKSYTTFELANEIKMNRFFFADQGVALKLISELKDFRAKVDKTIEQRKDDRGNNRDLKDQIVTSNIPESFNMCLPIFKGQDAQAFAVEIAINPSDLSCSLVSPEVNDLINQVKNEAIDKELDLIVELAPDLAIIEM